MMIFISEPGIYESKWRMSTNTGIFFGDTIWVIITVEKAGTLALTQQMNNFTDLGNQFTPSQPSLHFAENPFSIPKTTRENINNQDDDMQ